MTSGQGILIVGGELPTAPPDPPILPGFGVDGMLHMWDAAMAAYANLAPDGSTITGWDDYIETDPDNLIRTVIDVGAPEPRLGYDTVGGQPIPYVEFAGIDLVGSKQLTPPRSGLVVFRLNKDDGTLVNLVSISRMLGATISRASNGRIRIIPVTGDTIVAGAGSTAPGYHCVVYAADPTKFAYVLDGAYAEGAAYTAGVPGTMYTSAPINANGGAVGSNTGRLRSRATWPFVLNQAQLLNAYAAAKARFPDLP